MLLSFFINSKLGLPDEAETGNAGGQPARNNPVDWNGLEVGIKPASFKLIIPVIYALRNSNLLHVFLISFVHFTLVQYIHKTCKFYGDSTAPYCLS